MDEEDLKPRRKAPKGKDLESMSIEALNDYIAELEAEIARAKNMIVAKQSVRSGAEGLFRK